MLPLCRMIKILQLAEHLLHNSAWGLPSQRQTFLSGKQKQILKLNVIISQLPMLIISIMHRLNENMWTQMRTPTSHQHTDKHTRAAQQQWGLVSSHTMTPFSPYKVCIALNKPPFLCYTQTHKHTHTNIKSVCFSDTEQMSCIWIR